MSLTHVGDISIIFPCSFAVGITQQYGIYVLLGYVAAWAYDSIIYSGVNKRGRDAHCFVGVLGKSSHTL